MSGLLRFSSSIDGLNTLIGKLVSWLILMAVLVSSINAIIRKVFDQSSNAWLELQWYLFGAVFMLGAAWTLLRREHIRIDILFNTFPRRVRLWIELLGHILFLMPFVMLMVYESTDFVIRSIQLQEMSFNAGGLIVWPAKALVLVGFFLLFLQGISEIIKQVAVIRGILPEPETGSSHGQNSHES
ncbi:TRAP transporter small permease subunit [Prosthecomicrobium sp. N25]|uniref:TRAP transporter small permease subunit n=1 Tax=Prosthecomicrobium sp. N25 TaxID=3129254 RepID=UPI003076C328